MADTGSGATLTLATTGAVGTIKSMTLPEFTIDKLETSDLSTTDYKTYVKTDLAEPGELTAEIFFDGDVAVPSLGVAETVTVTFPKVIATNTAANLAGTGFITGYKMPELQTGELQMATLTIAFDGLTDPAFTVEA